MIDLSLYSMETKVHFILCMNIMYLHLQYLVCTMNCNEMYSEVNGNIWSLTVSVIIKDVPNIWSVVILIDFIWCVICSYGNKIYVGKSYQDDDRQMSFWSENGQGRKSVIPVVLWSKCILDHCQSVIFSFPDM